MKTDRNTLKEAVYQYLLDHTYPTLNGTIVNFKLPKKKEFYNKIKLRETGIYTRKTEEDVLLEFNKYKQLLNDYEQLKKAEHWRKRRDKKLSQLKKTGSVYIKFIIKIKEKLNKLINSRL